jgi:Ca2+-binding RTX toxin-like protein
MNGTQIDSAVSLGTPPTNWGIVDAHGDYNGDGKSDILWRDSTTGTTVLWQMNGTQIDSSTNLGAIPLNWNVVDGHGDYNGDGKSDILWRNGADGSVVLWQMNGNQIATSAALGAPPSNSGVIDGTEVGAALTGDSGNNTLLGTVENDTLSGLAGNDTLTGGAGADKFVFNTALSAGTNVDTVTDFASGTDKLVLDHLIFSALSAGNVAAGNFVAEASATAHDANDYILYNTTTGALSYDPDGSGALAATQFANLANHPAIAVADLAVVERCG